MNEMAIGAQLYIFRQKYNLETEMDFVLEGLASAGYSRIEGFFAGQQKYCSLLERHGLEYAAAHLVTGELENLDAVARYVTEMGGQDVCVSGPLQWNERSAEDYWKTADVLNIAAAKLHSHGVHLHYHNHDFEFTPFGETQNQTPNQTETGMDILLDRLDFGVMRLCLDAGWVWRGNLNPVAFLEAHAEKIGVLHLRDFRGAQSVPLGAGEIAQSPILALIPLLTNLRHVIIEQDPDSLDPMQDMKQSRQHLRDLDFA